MTELAPGIHSLGHGKGGHVHAFLIENGGELTLVDTLFENDAKLVLEAINRIGRKVTDLKRIAITHGHRSHLGGLAALKRASGATVYAHEWEADIVSGDRRAQPVSLLPRQSLRLIPFQLGLLLGKPKHVPAGRRAAGRRRRVRAAAGDAREGALTRPSGVLLARTPVPDRRRRGRDLARALSRLDVVQPQLEAAPALPRANGGARSGASSASATATRSPKAQPTKSRSVVPSSRPRVKLKRRRDRLCRARPNGLPTAGREPAKPARCVSERKAKRAKRKMGVPGIEPGTSRV